MCGMSQPPNNRSSATPPARPDASMSLLTHVMDHGLDEGYAQATAQRRADGTAGLPRTLKAKLGLAAGLVIAAMVVTLGAAQARVSAPVLAKERQELIDRVKRADEHADGVERDIERLRGTVADRQRAALKQQGGGDEGQLVGLLSGATEVRGPGVKLVVDDAKGSSSGGGGGPRESAGFSDTGRVRDRDMQRIVNGLWQSGAEAVSINGQRLTALSAIRAAGDAILVDNKPLVPPYEVLAIGDKKRLGPTFQNSADGQYLHVLQESYGIRYGLTAENDVRLLYRREPDRTDSYSRRAEEGCIVIAVLGLVAGVVAGLLVRPEVLGRGGALSADRRGGGAGRGVRRSARDAGRHLRGQGLRGVVPVERGGRRVDRLPR